MLSRSPPDHPWRVPLRRYLRRAAVAVIYRRQQDNIELLFIERARREGDPWSGDMAFPGGGQQADDASAWAAAVRETREELGIDLEREARYRGRLSDRVTRHPRRWRPMVVTPYVFEWRGACRPQPNHEVQSWLWIPLRVLADPLQRGQLDWRLGPVTVPMPCVRYQGKSIWGLSYAMVLDLLARSDLPVNAA